MGWELFYQAEATLWINDWEIFHRVCMKHDNRISPICMWLREGVLQHFLLEKLYED